MLAKNYNFKEPRYFNNFVLAVIFFIWRIERYTSRNSQKADIQFNLRNYTVICNRLDTLEITTALMRYKRSVHSGENYLWYDDVNDPFIYRRYVHVINSMLCDVQHDEIL